MGKLSCEKRQKYDSIEKHIEQIDFLNFYGISKIGREVAETFGVFILKSYLNG
jgi:lipid II:glycine glycyltransferase (peptidoglycan interpeptide bridge formation enzyme)